MLKLPLWVWAVRFLGLIDQRIATFICVKGNMGRVRFFQSLFPRYTQITYSQMQFIYDAARRLKKESIAGAFVQCGVWKGGSVVVMVKALEANHSPRQIWLFDSFEGMPESRHVDGDRALNWVQSHGSGKLVSIGANVATVEEVEKLLFQDYAFNRSQFQIRKGWFQDTLKPAKEAIGPIALLHIDADWYDSTLCCLESLYDSVSAGGIIFIDDYFVFEGVPKAITDFMLKRKIDLPLKVIDDKGVYFIKPKK